MTTEAGLEAPHQTPIKTNPFAVVLALASGLAAFFLVSSGLRACLPFPEVPAIAPKYRYFSAHKDDYDLLFVGSSRFYHQIIPKQFDALVEAASGRKVHSFNCAYDGMWPPESYYLIRQLLALRPARLRWVVVDAMDINPNLDDRNNLTMREAYWHDLQHTRMALRDVVDEPRLKAEKKWPMAEDHLLMFIRRAVNFGRGAEMLGVALEAYRHKTLNPPEWNGAEGFHAGLDKPMEGEELAHYHVMVTRLLKGFPPVKLSAAFSEAMSALNRDIRKAGAEPVYVIAPTLNPRENYTDLPDRVTLIPFNDPVKYSQLYDPAVHYDGWHLNSVGAKEFTRLLADRFVAQVKPGGSPEAKAGAPETP